MILLKCLKQIIKYYLSLNDMCVKIVFVDANL